MDEWKPLREVIQAPKVPLHPDVEKYFPANLFVGERRNEWLERYNALPEQFERLKTKLNREDTIVGFLATSDIIKNAHLFAVTAKGLWLIWKQDASYEKEFGNAKFTNFAGKKEEFFKFGDSDCPIKFQRKSGFFSIDAFIFGSEEKPRFIGFTPLHNNDRDDFYEIMARMGCQEVVKGNASAEASKNGCLVFFVPVILGALVYGATKL